MSGNKRGTGESSMRTGRIEIDCLASRRIRADDNSFVTQGLSIECFDITITRCVASSRPFVYGLNNALTRLNKLSYCQPPYTVIDPVHSTASNPEFSIIDIILSAQHFRAASSASVVKISL